MGSSSLDVTSLFGLRVALLCICGQGGFRTSGIRDMWSGQGPASSLNCPVILVLESGSIENESPVALWWEVEIMDWHLPHASLSVRDTWKVSAVSFLGSLC